MPPHRISIYICWNFFRKEPLYHAHYHRWKFQPDCSSHNGDHLWQTTWFTMWRLRLWYNFQEIITLLDLGISLRIGRCCKNCTYKLPIWLEVVLSKRINGSLVNSTTKRHYPSSGGLKKIRSFLLLSENVS